MAIPTLTKILQLIRPGAEYVIRGDEIEWLDQAHPEPTPAEIAAGAAALETLAYREKRAMEYPSIGDQLDALWKGGADAEAMRQQVMAVKAKHPKP